MSLLSLCLLSGLPVDMAILLGPGLIPIGFLSRPFTGFLGGCMFQATVVLLFNIKKYAILHNFYMYLI